MYHGGWIDSLKNKVASKNAGIDLGIAFHASHRNQVFTVGNVRYYAFPEVRSRSRIKRGIQNLLHQIEPVSVVEQYHEAIHDFKPDMIHVFGTEQAFGLLAGHVEVPLVIHLQGIVAACSRMWFRGISFPQALISSRLSDLMFGRGIVHAYFTFLKRGKRERTAFAHCKYFMGRTDWDRRLVSVFAPHAKYFHCDELMREDFYTTSWIPRERSRRILVSTFNGSVYKGFETLVEMVFLLKRLGRDVEMRVAGVTEDDYVVQLIKKLYPTNQFGTNIRLLGQISPSVLAGELANADAFVHPSHIDNSPNGVCEAMLVGTPVVSTNVGGIPSLLENNREGLLVQDGDPYALAGAVAELLDDSALAIRLSSQGRERARKRHDAQQIVDRVEKIYHEIIQDSKRG